MLSQIILTGLVGAFVIACYFAWSFAHGVLGRIESHQQMLAYQAKFVDAVHQEALLRDDILAQDRGQEFYVTEPVDERVKVIREAQPARLALRKIDQSRKAS